MGIVTYDFETAGIEQRPTYPPKPVGVAIKYQGLPAHYYAWGHPTGNSCTFEEGRAALAAAWESGDGLLAHNQKFDYDVATTHMGMPELPWRRLHDTMLLLFLYDPHAKTFALKPASDLLLGLKPEEQDAVRRWLVERGVVRKGLKQWGAFICEAPGGLVGKYANGDVERTEQLFDFLHGTIIARGMGAAYDRERRLLPILLDNERRGIRVDVERLDCDLRRVWRPAMSVIDGRLRSILGDINLDSNEELAGALVAAGLADESQFSITPTGHRAVSGSSLRAAVTSVEVFQELGYRSRLATCMSLFMEPWLAQAQRSGGVVQPSWSQVRQDGFGANVGARSGRLIASNPNLLNLSKSWDGREDGYAHPGHVDGVPPLPLVREYMLPDEGCVWAHRDYCGQELRILAHYEDGALQKAFCDNPRLDPHGMVQAEIKRLKGYEVDRRAVKVTNFLTIYGGGMRLLAEKLGMPPEEAKKIKEAQLAALPGLADLIYDLKIRARKKLPIKTWGGREYYCEQSVIGADGEKRSFEYKMLNYLIQPSAADATKEAIIRYWDARGSSRLLGTVYDEINISVPLEDLVSEMKVLKDCMESLEFEVPMLTDGKVGRDWGSLVKYEDCGDSK